MHEKGNHSKTKAEPAVIGSNLTSGNSLIDLYDYS